MDKDQITGRAPPLSYAQARQVFDAASQVGDLVRSGTAEQLAAGLDGLFRQAGGPELELAFHLLLGELCALLFTAAGPEKESLFQQHQSLYRLLRSSGSPEEAADALSLFCRDVQASIAGQRKMGGVTLCDRAVGMIEAEYAHPDMSLNYVSGQINVSPNYLSSLLKKTMGKSFIELLTARRMEAARAMLLHSSMKIREISEQCGYSDQHYFSHCVKKYTGLSPSALRRQERSSSEEG